MKGLVLKGLTPGFMLLTAAVAFAAKTGTTDLDKEAVKTDKEQMVYSAAGCMACHQADSTAQDDAPGKAD